MKGRDRAARAKVESMSKKKQKQPTPEMPNPLLVDEKEFTDVIRKMVNTKPVKREEVERRKNPETDPKYLPVFPSMPSERERKKR
jgi:hypothetical protein